MKRIFLNAFVLILLALGSCGEATAPVDPAQHEASVREAIKQTWESFIEAWEQGDASAVASFYTADAINMPSFGSTQNGPAEVEAMFADGLSSLTYDVLSQTTDEVFVHDEMAYELGSIEFEQTPTSSDDDPTVRRFRYVSTFKRQSDGSWKFHRWLGQPNQ
jgi:uncharacterized protein (TIGR02246 family)